MSTTESPDQPINLSIIPFLRFLVSMPSNALEAFCRALMECSDEVRSDVLRMFEIAEDASLTKEERLRALNTVADQLRLLPDEEGRYGMDLAASEAAAAARFPSLARQVDTMDTQEAEFAERLRQLTKDKCITQSQLAERVDCSQPAISQMLNRKCRPQRKTLEKIAAALNVDVRELWPDLDVMDNLDAVAAFQQDGYVMTEDEAKALRDPKLPRSAIKGQPLPSRKKSPS